MLTGGPNYMMIRRAIFGKVLNIRAWPVAPKLCSLAPGWLDVWDTVMGL